MTIMLEIVIFWQISRSESSIRPSTSEVSISTPYQLAVRTVGKNQKPKNYNI
jgi:hypothetical protein